MKYILKKYNLKIPDSVLLKDIRKTAKKHGSRTLSRALYDTEGKFNPGTIRKRFGNWNSALLLAGLKIQKVSFVPTEHLLQNLKLVWDHCGRLLIAEMKPPVSAYGVSVYVKRFGSWQKALKAFIKYNAKHRGKIPVLRSAYRNIPKNTNKQLRVNLALRYSILKRDDFKCMFCGNSPALTPGLILHVDHIIPLARGGETVPENLQTLCRECNYGKGAKI